MKELTIEQKAKAYDEALERARQIHNEHKAQCFNVMEKVFPELAESKDENIKRRIIKLIKMSNEVGGFALHKWEADEMLAWLEKQGDKDSQVILPSFTFDDILALQCCMETVKKVQEDKELYEQLQSLHDRLHDAYRLEKQGEQKSAEEYNITGIGSKHAQGKLGEMIKNLKPINKIEPKFKVGDLIRHIPNDINASQEEYKITRLDDKFYYSELKDGTEIILFGFPAQDTWELVEQNPAWSEEDEKERNHCIDFLNHPDTIKATPTIANACIDWLKSLKERVQPQPRKEWSEEDNNILVAIENALTTNEGIQELKKYSVSMHDAADWLESLKDRLLENQ